MGLEPRRQWRALRMLRIIKRRLRHPNWGWVLSLLAAFFATLTADVVRAICLAAAVVIATWTLSRTLGILRVTVAFVAFAAAAFILFFWARMWDESNKIPEGLEAPSALFTTNKTLNIKWRGGSADPLSLMVTNLSPDVLAPKQYRIIFVRAQLWLESAGSYVDDPLSSYPTPFPDPTSRGVEFPSVNGLFPGYTYWFPFLVTSQLSESVAVTTSLGQFGISRPGLWRIKLESETDGRVESHVLCLSWESGQMAVPISRC
jgi:hypothetical protein